MNSPRAYKFKTFRHQHNSLPPRFSQTTRHLPQLQRTFLSTTQEQITPWDTIQYTLKPPRKLSQNGLINKPITPNLNELLVARSSKLTQHKQLFNRFKYISPRNNRLDLSCLSSDKQHKSKAQLPNRVIKTLHKTNNNQKDNNMYKSYNIVIQKKQSLRNRMRQFFQDQLQNNNNNNISHNYLYQLTSQRLTTAPPLPTVQYPILQTKLQKKQTVKQQRDRQKSLFTINQHRPNCYI